MKALFIGRFQPFHKGHLKVVENISEKYDEIIIGIGSSQYKETIDNPFSSDERKQMIIDSLQGSNVNNYRIVLIPDIHNPPKWVAHVVSIVSDFDVVIANDSFTKQLFSEAGYDVEKTILFGREKYSGKKIRKKMILNEDWESLVPDNVAQFIKEINGLKRLKDLSENLRITD